MHLKHLLFLIGFVLCATTGISQTTTLLGTVTDAESGKPLPGATVAEKGFENGTITDSEGRFRLVIVGKSTTLRVSFVGFETQEVRVGAVSPPLDIRMVPEDISLPTTTITDGRPHTVHPEKEWLVQDYHILDGHIAVIVRGDEERKNRIELLNVAGEVVDEIGHLPEQAASFYKDCLGNLHCLTKNFAWQLDYVQQDLFVRKVAREDFEEMIVPCTGLLDSTYFYALSPDQYLRHFIFVRSDELRRRHLYASVDSTAITYQMDEALMPTRYVSGHDVQGQPRTCYSGGFGLDKRTLTDVFLKPSYVPLKIVGERAVVFDHTHSRMVQFDARGEMAGEYRIDYQEDKHWSRQVITDEERERAYTLFEKNGLYTLTEIDLDSGELGNSWELPKQFVKNIKVWKGAIYFLYSDSNYDPVQRLYRMEM